MTDEPVQGQEGATAPGWPTALAALAGLGVGPSVLAVMSYGVFAAHLDAAFGWGIAATALGGTILSIMIMIASPLQGVLVDRLGARPLVLWSIPLFGLGFAAMALMSGPLWMFYLAWILLPLLGVGIWPGAYLKATADWFDRRLGLAVAVASTGIGLGAACVPLVVDALADRGGWRLAYVVVGLGSIAVAWPIAFLFLRQAPRQPVRRGQQARGALDVPALWRMLLAFFLFGFVSSAMLVHQVAILTDNGLSRSQAVQLQAVTGLSTIAGRLFGGAALDRWAVRRVMPVFALLCAMALLALGAGAAGMVALLGAVAVGFLIGAEMDVLAYAVKRYFGRARYATLYGAIFAVFQLGAAIGVSVIGVWRGASGSFAGGLLTLAAVALAGGLVLATLGPYPGRLQDEGLDVGAG